MSKDFAIDLFNNAYMTQVKKMRNNGLSDSEIIDKLKDIDFTDCFSKITEMMADDSTKYMENTMYERVLEERAQAAEFMARNEQIWGKGFVASEAMYVMVVETAELYGEYLETQNDDVFTGKENTLLALREIHGRACQQFLEIIYLMKAGFADGAYARWRSLYELSVIAQFISDQGETVATAFVYAYDSNDNWYNWAKASGCFGTQKNIRFADIQSKCCLNTQEWKRQYSLANKIVHASPQGTFGRLSNYTSCGATPVGHSDYGLSIPAEHSAISLSYITTLFLTLIPYGDGLVHIQSIHKWVEIVRKYYFDAENTCFSESNEPHTTRIDGTKVIKD